MADLSKIIGDVLKLADSVNGYLPMSGTTQLGIDLGKKVIDIIDTVGDDIPLDKQGEAQEARAKLAASVKAKAAATSARLRG